MILDIGDEVTIKVHNDTKKGIIVRKYYQWYYVRVKMIYTKFYKVLKKDIRKDIRYDNY